VDFIFDLDYCKIAHNMITSEHELKFPVICFYFLIKNLFLNVCI